MTTPSNEQSLEGLVERVKRWFGISRRPPIELVWRSQHYVHPLTGKPLDPDNPNVVYHFAGSPAGRFEICEMGVDLMLHFPRSMKLPAELFHDLAEAKARALTALKDASE